jgi:hypothetical protein
MTKARTLTQVNKAIQKVYPTLNLTKGEGYFYLYSDDDATGNQLAMWYCTSIYSCHLNQCTVEQWVESVEMLAEDVSNTEGYGVSSTKQ